MSAAGGMQELIVFVCVAAAAAYALRRLMPKSVLRLKMLFAESLEHLGRPGMAQGLREQAKSASGCDSGCGSCGSCDSPSKALPETRLPAEKTVRFHRPH